MTLIRWAILILIVVLAGCKANVRPAPSVISVPEKYYVTVPTEYTQDCPIDDPNPRNADDFKPLGIKHLAELRRLALVNCNKDKAHIRNIQGSAAPKDK